MEGFSAATHPAFATLFCALVRVLAFSTQCWQHRWLLGVWVGSGVGGACWGGAVQLMHVVASLLGLGAAATKECRDPACEE